MDDLLEGVRALALKLPETNERLSHGMPTFFIRNKKTFVNFTDGHHGDEHTCLWLAAPDGAQQQLVDQEPHRFFVPPYVGHRGWLGLRLDVDLDWDEVAQMVEEAFRCVAPKTLLAQLDGE